MKIEYVFVLDKSSSMSSVTELTRQAIREYLTSIQVACTKDNIDGYVTVMLFDTHSYEYVYKRTPARDVDLSMADKYQPAGSTPIYDAIAKGILDLQDQLGDEAGDEDRHVLFSVYSDGEENSSTLFNAGKIRKMIEHLQEGRWTFTFQCAGAERTIKAFAQSIAIAEDKVQAYAATEEGFRGSYASLNNALSVYTSGIACEAKIGALF